MWYDEDILKYPSRKNVYETCVLPQESHKFVWISEHLFIMYIFDTTAGMIRFRKVDKFSRTIEEAFSSLYRGRIYFS